MKKLIAGAILIQDGKILLVREMERWEFPKGEVEPGETIVEAAKREVFEETGLVVEIGELIFVSEYFKQERFLVQFCFEAQVVSGELSNNDPAGEIQEARYIPLEQLRQHMTFRPRLLPLEQWLSDGLVRHHTFNLNIEPAFIEEEVSA